MSIESLIYVFVAGIVILVLGLYMRKIRREDRQTSIKIEQAKESGVHEPVSLHPFIDLGTCIKSGACLKACPEEDVLGIRGGRATLVNATHCVGHGACFHACPMEAISLRIGTEKRGVELPHVNQNFETNVKGIFIAGELGGMGLIKNSVEQGKQAMDSMAAGLQSSAATDFDIVIVGAGPAGISASLQAKKLGLKAITLDQDSIGGTVFSFPRAKVVMTAPMDLPLHGPIKLFNTSKTELLAIWLELIKKHQIQLKEHEKVERIVHTDFGYVVETATGSSYSCQKVLLAIGRRGTPRKLGVVGEDSEKVAYRLIEAEYIQQKHVLVVGGGDSAVESAMLLMDNNTVSLSYRGEQFSRLKPLNKINIEKAISDGKIKALMPSNVKEIKERTVILEGKSNDERVEIENDLVYIFAGGELPTGFLQQCGIEVMKRFAYTVKSHHS